MSGLEKFCESDEWRTNLEKLFLTERKPIQKCIKSDGCHVYSLNIMDDIIKQKSIPKNQNNNQNENIHNVFEEICSHKQLNVTPSTNNWNLTSNETFETLEELCQNNTENTSFEYLYTKKKEDNCSKSGPSEQPHYLNIEKTNEISIQNNITIIEDIEAPSKFWDNTIINVPINKSNSPYPSTILDGNDISLKIPTVLKKESYETLNESSDYMTAIDNATIYSSNTSFTKCFPEIINNENSDENIYISSGNGEDRSMDNTENSSVRNNSFKTNNILQDSFSFDNTIEEIDYILQKGLQRTNANRNNSKVSKENVQDSKYSLQSKMETRHIIDIKQIPKFDLFRKPNGIAKGAISRRRELSDKTFAHITSPISAYVKKTGITPLLATIKISNHKINVHNSTIFPKLDYESHINNNIGDIGTNNRNVDNNLDSVPVGMHSLPKKTYISSQFKHIINEGTIITIPGGKNIHKYLEKAKLPAVVRHEGKVKVHRTINKRTKFPFEDPTEETFLKPNIYADLCDLSTVSGDVSLYTIRDAQKF